MIRSKQIFHYLRQSYLWLIISLLLVLFTLIAIAIIQAPQGLAWELPILLAIHRTATPQLDIFAAWFTKLGIYFGVVPLIFLLIVRLSWVRQWRSLIYVIITTLGAITISYTAKIGFHRPRPHLWDLFYPVASDYAFPSGHAISSMTFIVILAVLTWKTRWYQWVIILGSIFVLIIGWTRLYLGVHYPSDILGGWIIAIAWGMGVNIVLKDN